MKNKITQKDREEALAEEIKNIRKYFNPKGKVRRVYKIEEDGTKTRARALQMGDRVVFHSEDGPALINKEQKIKEYYLNGIQYTMDKWKDIKKSGEGLPWYKQSGSTVKTARF